MASQSLEQRVAELESQVNQLRDEVRRSKLSTGKDWRRTIGAFTDNEGMQEILQEAMRIREAGRQKARSKKLSDPETR
jgi:hypothetical protein